MLKRSTLATFCVCILVPAWTAFAALDPSLVAWWAFDDGAGTIATDGSGNGNDGTVEGGAVWVPGRLGTALQFNGSGAQVRAPHIPLDNRDFTVALWVRPSAISGDRNVFSQDGANNSSGRMHFRITGAGVIRMGYYGNDLDTPANTLATNEWSHLAFVHDLATDTRRVVVSGLEVASDNGAPFVGTSGDTVIGSQYGSEQYFDGLIDDVQIYHRPLSNADIARIMTGLVDRAIAQDPDPADETADVPRAAVLGWNPGAYAAAHDVYLGTVLADVESADRSDPRGVLINQGQSGITCAPEGLLDFAQTYYWRVDEVNGAPDVAIHKGDVWSFTTEPHAYLVSNITATASSAHGDTMGPEKTVDGSGLNDAGTHSIVPEDMWLSGDEASMPWIQYEFDRPYTLHEMWVWNSNQELESFVGMGAKDVTIETSMDGLTWTALADVPQFGQAPGLASYTADTIVAFGGVTARFVKLTVADNWGQLDQTGLSEVRFFQIPTFARYPVPADGGADVPLDATLNWRAGRQAAGHTVYFGTDATAVADGTAPAQTTDETVLSLADLLFGHAYYWRVDEVNEAYSPPVIEGDLWSFTTAPYALLDDMESYTDDLDAGQAIFQTWIDGWENGSGATVGYIHAPFAETWIVNSGRQSMPLAYDNSASPFYSEAQLDLGGMDLTGRGADTLGIYVAGAAPAFYEDKDGVITMNGTGVSTTSDQCRYGYRTLTGNGSMIARVDDIAQPSDDAAMGGVMIRDSADIDSTHVFTCLTGGYATGGFWIGRLGRGQTAALTPVPTPIAPPYWVRVDRTGNSFSGFISPDGVTWTQIGAPRTIAMQDPVLIGLTLTSNNADVDATAQFSHISTTGNVTDAWQVAEIGIAQPEGNMAAPLYVALEDNAGHVAVATHPDQAIAVRPNWTQWCIPYSDLDGLDLTDVRTIYVGLGDRDNPAAGGTGTIYVDDIGFGHPVTE